MSFQHLQLGYDQITFRESLRLTMDQKAIETILRFVMAKMPEAEFRELDALLERFRFGLSRLGGVHAAGGG